MESEHIQAAAIMRALGFVVKLGDVRITVTSKHTGSMRVRMVLIHHMCACLHHMLC